MTTRRWLIASVVLAVLVVTAVVVLAIPTRHVSQGATHPKLASFSFFAPRWVCVSDYTNPAYIPFAATDHRVPLRVGIALGGLALAVAVGVAVHNAHPPAPLSTAASDADTIRAGPVEGETT